MFADVEVWVRSFVWQLISPDQLVGQIVTAGMSFSRQLDLLAALFRHRFPDPALREALNKIIARISALEQSRNAILHSAWLTTSVDPNSKTVLRFKITADRKKGLVQTKEVMTVEQLDDIGSGFEKAVAELGSFMIPLVADLWPEAASE